MCNITDSYYSFETTSIEEVNSFSFEIVYETQFIWWPDVDEDSYPFAKLPFGELRVHRNKDHPWGDMVYHLDGEEYMVQKEISPFINTQKASISYPMGELVVHDNTDTESTFSIATVDDLTAADVFTIEGGLPFCFHYIVVYLTHHPPPSPFVPPYEPTCEDECDISDVADFKCHDACRYSFDCKYDGRDCWCDGNET